MNINKFAEEIETSARKRLGETYKTEIRELTKNNSVKRIALSICPSKENLSPNIYLESYYEQYSHGESMEYIVDCLLAQLHNAIKDTGDFKLEIIQNFQPDQIIPTLVNFERNKGILETIPYTPWLDLAVTYRIMIDFDKDTLSSALINQTMLQAWGMKKEEIGISGNTGEFCLL